MAQSMRFGRRLALPSTRQIRHELLVFSVREEARLKDAEKEKAQVVAVPVVPVT